MKKTMLTLGGLLCAAWLSAQSYQKTTHGIRTTVNGVDVEVQFFTPSVVRVVKTPAGKTVEKQSLSVTASPEEVSFKAGEKNGHVVLESKKLRVSLNTVSGVISYKTASGSELLKEQAVDSMFIPFNDAGTPTFNVYQSFRLDKEEAIYGLGQFQNGKMSLRGLKKNLIQTNLEDVSPVFQSTKGYGLFWDNYSPTMFTDDETGTSFRSEVGDCMDYYFMYGGNADGVVACLRHLTGEVPMFPLWTYGFWQSKERYKSQDEVVGVVRKYRDLGVPLDGIIQDWQYWGHNYLWNAMDFTNPLYPRPQQMLDDVHAMNAHMAISIWSSFGPATKPYRELKPKGMLLEFSTWPESGMDAWPPIKAYPSGVRAYDPYNPEARDIYWKYLNNGIFKYGMDAWWMDSTEPDHLSIKPGDYDVKTWLGSFRKVRNAYPLMTVGGVSDHQRAATSDKRVFILTRSGLVGQQRYGSSVWSGDVGSSWENLRKQVPAGLNFSLCGMPQWNHDIGGFFAGQYNFNGRPGSAPRNPLFQELFVRWLQFGVFTPMMRSHGTDTPREIYEFGRKGETVYDAIEKAIRLRYSLLPYIYSTSWDVTHRQSTFMRALVMDFPKDKKGWDRNDEYMFGKAFLVAPVLHAQYTTEKVVRMDENTGWNKENKGTDDKGGPVDFTEKKAAKVYLPEGASWYNFWTGKKERGGQEVDCETTLDIFPLYVRAGSIVPLGPDVQYATEKPWDELVLRVYPGADGSFTLYEDEFDNYNYEKGAYTEIPLSWDDSSRRLTIGKRTGSYEGMIAERNFRIVLPDGTGKTVHYDGKSMNVKL
ncbi:TIM-barrel domain-containing protein [Bacteroides acidifaciens]|uniref:glycoside hydrolase family 31 protein n=1 Tax=Bacteroides acidifaciens TaxID=85831 RepID=UPI003013BE47